MITPEQQAQIDAWKKQNNIVPVQKTSSFDAIDKRIIETAPKDTQANLTGFEEQKQDIMQMGSEIKESTLKRADKVGESMQAYGQGQQGLIETTGQVLGQGAGYASDIFGSLFKGAIKSVLSQERETQIKKGLETATKPVMENEITKNIIKQYNELDERTKRNIDASLGIVSLGLDVATMGGGKKAGQLAIEKAIEPSLKQTGKLAGEAAETLEKGLANKSFEEALNVTKPILSKTEKEAAIIAERGEQKGFKGLGKIELKPSNKDIIIAKSVEGFVSESKNAFDNIKAVNDLIKKSSDITDEALDKVVNIKTIFNEKKLKSVLNTAKEESRVVFGSDKSLESIYDATVDEFIRISKKYPKTPKGLRDTRIEFDNVMEKKFPKIFTNPLGDNVRQNAIMDVRRAANDMIAESLPEGQLKSQMMQMSNMFDARKNIAKNAVSQIDTNLLERTLQAIRKHPVVATGTAFAIGGIGLSQILTNPMIMVPLLTGGTYSLGKKIITSEIVQTSLIKFLRATEKTLNPADKQAVQSLINELGKTSAGLSIEKIIPDIPNDISKLSKEELQVVKSKLQIGIRKYGDTMSSGQKDMIYNKIGEIDDKLSSFKQGEIPTTTLEQEARKYKTAEEFVNNQQGLFRGEPSKLKGRTFGGKIKINKDGVPETIGGNMGVPTSKDLGYVKQRFVGQIEDMGELGVYSPKEKIKILSDPQEILKLSQSKTPQEFYFKDRRGYPEFERGIFWKNAKNAGYDAVDLSKIENIAKTESLKSPEDFLVKQGNILLDDNYRENEVRILNLDKFNLKTKSQLTDIWEKANKIKK